MNLKYEIIFKYIAWAFIHTEREREREREREGYVKTQRCSVKRNFAINQDIAAMQDLLMTLPQFLYISAKEV